MRTCLYKDRINNVYTGSIIKLYISPFPNSLQVLLNCLQFPSHVVLFLTFSNSLVSMKIQCKPLIPVLSSPIDDCLYSTHSKLQVTSWMKHKYSSIFFTSEAAALRHGGCMSDLFKSDMHPPYLKGMLEGSSYYLKVLHII